ncbi:hypothetical protein MIMGU_mgv1a024600mg [Erythranthe guttata]|uniref:NB-ARC domain-containing protein n=2 Tax=Erythranthe guttata TaxID=4155 RepID=A0A022QAJ1_ERYGU|nr:hypothetical protein MIMGU_mgv1a024600mg [Erythranthe guttata]
MAYAAAISLKNTIERLSSSSHISIVTKYSRRNIKLLYKEVLSLLVVLEELDSNNNIIDRARVDALDGLIREAVYRFEDALDSHVSDQFISQSEGIDADKIHQLMLISVDLKDLKEDIDFFIHTVNEMMKAYTSELHDLLPVVEEEDEDEDVDGDADGSDDFFDSRTEFVENETMMVGLSDLFVEIKERLMDTSAESERVSLSLVGMAGIGKTALANKLYQDSSISSHFERCAFVTVGPEYVLEGVLVDILEQVHDEADEKMDVEGHDILDGLEMMTYTSLKERRYLIMLDDVWHPEIWDDLLSVFPDDNNGSRVLLTTRLLDIASSNWCEIRFLDKKESWDLLRHKVFGEMTCPHELEKPGKKIAENCEGLPLTIVTVAGILSKAERTTEYWNKVAEKQTSVFTEAYDQMFEVLYPSYNYLPQHLKASFLYVGVFPQNCEIRSSTLTNLWSAEGFPDAKSEFVDEKSYVFSEHYTTFLELTSKNVIMSHKESYNRIMKTCSLHSPFWYMCNKEARKNKFFYGVKSLEDSLAEGNMKNQRRLCIRNNVLFAIKDAYDSMESISTVRSLLCTGQYHQYPVPLCSGLRLLRVLDALSIRFYEFPVELLNLVQLAYLAVTFNGKVPPSISRLWNLKWLIINRHWSIISHGAPLQYMPIEIWNMQELKHLQVMGITLFPPTEGSLLPNLLTLLDVSPQSCTKDVLDRIPNLDKLGIRIELSVDDVEPALSCFDHISHLDELRSLKCVVLNPIFKPDIVAPPAPLSIFSSSLQKLNLSGLGYPWEEMRNISLLPNLRVLKLRCYAFRGPKWEVRGNGFRRLKFLLIEDTDLVHWTFRDNPCLYVLESISMKNCYKLEEIPLSFGRFLSKIEFVDCNPKVVACAKMSKKYWDKRYYDTKPLDLDVHSSWDDKKLVS